jgi:hypothetical protein
MQIVLRAAEERDKPFLRWLEEACMRDYAVALWGVWRAEKRFVLSILRQATVPMLKKGQLRCPFALSFM